MKLIVRVYDIHSSDRLYEFGRGVKGREAPKPKRVLVSISIFVFVGTALTLDCLSAHRQDRLCRALCIN